MKQHTILIGLPRSGTTWVHSYIRQYYENYGIVLPTIVKTIKGESVDIGSLVADEWFDVDRYRDTDRIQMLEACRQCGFEICHKVLVSSLSRKYLSLIHI